MEEEKLKVMTLNEACPAEEVERARLQAQKIGYDILRVVESRTKPKPEKKRLLTEYITMLVNTWYRLQAKAKAQPGR